MTSKAKLTKKTLAFITPPLRFTLLKLMIVLATTAWSFVASAECSKQDIDFYIEKGFTQEQITKLCTFTPAAKSEKPAYQPYTESDRYRYDEEREARREAREKREDVENFLRAAISAFNVELTPESLKYTRKVCIKAGLDPDPSRRLKVCPNVNYDISLNGLLVLSSGKKYVYFGNATVDIKSDIKREIIGDLANFPDYQRSELLSTFKGDEPEGETSIPIRDDIPLERVVQTLRDLSG